jgi:hypothetical protein
MARSISALVEHNIHAGLHVENLVHRTVHIIICRGEQRTMELA